MIPTDDNIINMLKADRKAAQLKALEDGAKAAVYSAEQTYGAGHGEIKKAYAMDYLVTKGYGEEGSEEEFKLFDEAIEAAVYQMKHGTKKKKQPPKVAQTAEEFREKYSKKRFTPATAWKLILYNYVYAAYQIGEGAIANEIKQLYSITPQSITSRIEDAEDMLRYNAFVHLQEWTKSTFETAVFIRNSLWGVISCYYNMVTTMIAAEEITEGIGHKAEEPRVSQWLTALSIDGYSPLKDMTTQKLRVNIELSLRYLNAYNTFIEIVAAAVKVPEFAIFKVSTNSTDKNLSELNEALSELVSLIKEHRGTEDKYLIEGLKAFEPVATEAEPIPEGNIKKADAIISVICQQGRRTWTKAFATLYEGYWRQS